MTKKFRTGLSAYLILLFSFFGCFACVHSATADIRIGVLAYRGNDVALREWQGHADYLTRQIPGQTFRIMPLGYTAIEEAVRTGTIDLLITNTGHYTELEATGRVSRVATRLIAGPQGPLNHFGGVAITRPERLDLIHYADLKRKSLAIPDRSSLGGWQMHLREAKAQGLDLEKDVAHIQETGNHEKVIDAVLSGKADAGFIRADLIESLQAAGKLPAHALRIIDARHTSGYPFLHSTRLYPEWPLARVGDLPEAITKQVLIALLAMPAEAEAAKQAHIHGWTLPQNYQTVHDLFRETHLGPYANQEVTWQDIFNTYGTYLLGCLLALAGVLLMGIRRIIGDNQRLREREQALRLAAAVFRHAEEGILIANAKGVIVDVNDSVTRLTGYGRGELIGQKPSLLSSGMHDTGFYHGLWKTLLQEGFWRGELKNRRKDGSLYTQHTSISSIRDESGETTHYIGMIADITDVKANQEKLEHMAYYDALTGLPNRALLSDRLHQAIALAERHQHHFAICYLDLDNFKPINDQWGHATGDQVLVEVARRLTHALRQNDTVCRLGGDEFVILLNELSSPEEISHALQRVHAALDAPLQVGDTWMAISASTGITVYPDDATDPDMLLRHADHAMYIVKHSGRRRQMRYRQHMAAVDNAQALEIEQAFREREFVLYYQPKVDMRQGEIVGAEALVRWQHPTRGLLLPENFLPLIDTLHRQAELGEYVIREALAQMTDWAKRGLQLAVSLNIDAVHLQQADFPERLDHLLDAYPDVLPPQLEFEIVETAALQDLEQISERIAACRQVGVQFAIDDFGTGYSSLSYLKQLPMQTLKIDGSFVQSMLDNPDDLAIVDGVIGLAGAFRRRVVAEGVATIEHGTLLLKLGCEWGQGFGIARPMPAAALANWILEWKQPAEWRVANRWPSGDLPLLTVEIDHVRWIRQLETVLMSDDETLPLPPTDPRDCRFGQWLRGDGRVRYSGIPAFEQVVERHLDAHRCGQELLTLRAESPVAARARISELHRCRTRLLDSLHHLHRAVMHLPA